MSRTGSAAPFPWDEVLNLLLGRLRWTPDRVWAATPREVAAAIGPSASRLEPMRPDELGALMRSFPDRPDGA